MRDRVTVPWKPAQRNEYFLLRHGQSVANREGLIICSLERGLNGYGLTDEGAEAVRTSVRGHQDELSGTSRIISSDFLRARQTAEIAAEILGVGVEFSALLRERDFGAWDGQSHDRYRKIWQSDASDADQQSDGVESVRSVATRMMEQIDQIEASCQGERVLLVSHGDPLQILCTAAAGGDLRKHREIASIETAEVRKLEFG